MDLKTGVALVTGAAQGIGKAISEELLKKGCKVCCCDVNAEKGNKTVQELQEIYGKTNCFFDKCDVLSSEEFEATYLKTKETFGYVNILINNAGVLRGRIMEINVNSVINGCNIAYKYMGKHNGGNGGAVVNLSSIAALLHSPFIPIYSASKAAVLSLTRCFGHDIHYQKTGIKFFALCPAAIDTEMFSSISEGAYFPKHFDAFIENIVMLPPTAVAEAVIQLLQDGKNGAVMTVIGGKENSYVSFDDPDSLLF